MKKFFLKNKNRSLGFTLIEAIVAIAVLVMALAGPLTLAYQSIRFAAVAKDKLIAANLAQEGIELILAMRANNFLNNQNWLNGIAGSGGCSDNGITPCAIDASTNSPVEKSIAECLYLTINSGIYQCRIVPGELPVFSRVINIKVNSSFTSEALITSTVSWTDKYGSSQVILKEYILDWTVPQT